jgi:hypothetical protein
LSITKVPCLYNLSVRKNLHVSKILYNNCSTIVIFLKTGTSTFNQCEGWNVMKKKRIEKFYPETVLHQNNMIKFGKSILTLQASSFYLFLDIYNVFACLHFNIFMIHCLTFKVYKEALPTLNYSTFQSFYAYRVIYESVFF